VLEFAALGPGPFAAMLLADLGADVVRIDRPGTVSDQVLSRGKRSIALDLKQPSDVAFAMELADRAELLVEGYRPGVMERLGLGPDILIGRNPALVYGRMTGWGQTGPLAQAAGHDINYISITPGCKGKPCTKYVAVPPNSSVATISNTLIIASWKTSVGISLIIHCSISNPNKVTIG
jgi:alpha-methylacyl-CoA racemase